MTRCSLTWSRCQRWRRPAQPGFAVGRYLDDYLFTRDELKRALSSVKDGLTTQHLIAGHQVTLDGDSAVCLAQSINVHLTSGMALARVASLPVTWSAA